MIRFYRRSVIVLTVCLVGSIGLLCFAQRELSAQKSTVEALYDQVELLAEAITIIQSDYVNEVEPKRLIYGALKGLVESLDRHSQFMDPAAFTEMQVETKGEFGGVGLEITISKDDYLTVVAPIDDTPSSKAGLRPNDKIVKIDGQSTRGISLHEAVKRLRGRPGTKVELSVFRETDSKMLDFTLTRAVIKIQSVKEAKLVDGQIAYVRIAEFQDGTGRDLKRTMEQLDKGELDGLILDLRNNPGGLLDVAVEVASVFLPKGSLIVSIKGRIKNQDKEYYAELENPHLEFPIVVLINGGSASASEIVAGALRDHERGILMGTKSFGKGSVQTVMPLKDGSAIRLTTSLYYTPSGKTIHGAGLEPDVSVNKEQPPAVPEKEQPEIPGEGLPEQVADPVVLRAVDLLKGIKVYKIVR
ncbi:MAG: S41 family peptidase [Candidatus Omnitrophica bacterium]|nr:S41 family peptidase [Candidatus Omnitrophota bacterium]